MKPNNDTPRTNAKISIDGIEPMVHADFARQLERELASAKAALVNCEAQFQAQVQKTLDEMHRSDALRAAIETVPSAGLFTQAGPYFQPPFRYSIGAIWGSGEGAEKLLDIRGWGHLTGGGAHNLPAEQAAKIQDEIGEHLAQLLNASWPKSARCALAGGCAGDLGSSPKAGEYWQHQTAGRVKLIKKWNEREWIVEDARGHRQPRFLELMWPLKTVIK